MAPNYLLGLTALLACCFVEISSRPSNNESTPHPEEISAKEPKAIADREDGSISYQADTDINVQEESTKQIVDKIKAINSVLNKPRRPQINFNSLYSDTSNGIDEETLQRIKLIIALEKLNSHSETKNQPRNYDSFEDERNPYSRAYRITPSMVYPNTIPMIPYYYPYAMNYPVLVAPQTNEILSKYVSNSDLKSVVPSEVYQTRQEQQPLFPGFPSFSSFSFDNLFQFRPFSQLFPVLIKNPFVAFSQGGGLENFVEYGQNADVCSRKQKSSDDEYSEIIKKLIENNGNLEQTYNKRSNDDTFPELNTKTRESRALLKRTIQSGATEQEVDSKNSRKISVTKATRPSSTRATTKRPLKTKQTQDLENDYDGSLRFQFGNGFNWFGEKKPVAPSPGFFINRLRVRKGGVAIAGPGGVATAGRGGTAIVGPGGLAYTKPGGMAIAGPHARVVALSQSHDFNDLISRAAELDDKSRSSMPIREGKLVATGPVIYYHPTEAPTTETFLEAVKKNVRQNRQGIVPDVYNYDGKNFVRNLHEDPTYVLHLSPKASAVTGEKGIAISNPISRVIIRRGEVASIIHSPRTTAVAGAGGIAHAESELDVYEFDPYYYAATQYIPFYGGGKGQYLEVKKDTRGVILSEKVVTEDNISSENILKNKDENLLSKVLTVNLQNLKSLSSNLLKLQNLGRKTGTLGQQERMRFKNQLVALGEAASNTIKLIDEIGEDVDVLFKRNTTLLRQYGDNYEEDVGEEGVGIDSEDNGESYNDGTIIAEARPVGLAVIGESGLAASRPKATAVASSGVAIASPMATAIAGVDPSYLNIDWQHNSQKSYKINGKYY